MASNFKFSSYRTGDGLHLKLYGDFDGNSAFELINALATYATDFYQIFVDTNELSTVYPFGIDVFQKNFGILNLHFNNLIILGKYQHGFSPS